jgi:hypothetical protein
MQEMDTVKTQLSSESLFPTAYEILSEYLEGIDVRRDLSKIKLWHSSLTKISLSPEPVRQIKEWLTSLDPSMIWLRGYIVQRNLTIMTSLVLQALEWRERFARDSNNEGIDGVFTEERLEEAMTLDNIWSLFIDIVRLLPKAPVIVIDLIDTYFHYGNSVRNLIDRLATLVPGLNSEDADDKAIVGIDGLSRACKILITSKTTCILLEKTILKHVKVDVLDSPRWRVSRNNELELGLTLREDVEKAESDNGLSNDSDESDGTDGYATA